MFTVFIMKIDLFKMQNIGWETPAFIWYIVNLVRTINYQQTATQPLCSMSPLESWKTLSKLLLKIGGSLRAGSKLK